MLHALALTMSSKWTGEAVGQISQMVMEEVMQLIDQFPWLISLDNVQIPFQFFAQQLDNKGEFRDGTAAMVYIKWNATTLSELVNSQLKSKHAEWMVNRLTELNIIDIANESWPCIERLMTYKVLRYLLDSPEFD